MRFNVWVQWWRSNQGALIYGLGAGVMWGFLLTGSVTPHAQLVYDSAQGIVYQYPAAGAPIAIPAEQFFMNYYISLIQLTLILLVVSGLAGWATWQLTRLRPRQEAQLPLRQGVDAYVLALSISGLIYVWLFIQFGWADWFNDPGLTLAKVTSVTLELTLPLYMGIVLFLVWLLRLKSVRAPDWETHYPKPEKRPAGAPRFNWWRTQGGKHRSKH